MVAVVDRRGSDIYTVDSDGAVVGETVQGEGHPLHKIRHGGGWAAWSIQHRVDEKIRRNIDEVAHEVGRLAEQVQARVIVIGGEVSSRAALADALPAHGAEVVAVEAGARAAGADQGEFDEQVHKVVTEAAEREQRRVLEQYATERGRPDGLAVAGLAETTAALGEANVDRLLISGIALGDRLVQTEPAPILPVDEVRVAAGDTLTASICRADEALPVAALTCGATITPIDEASAPPEGVGALLRHRRNHPPTMTRSRVIARYANETPRSTNSARNPTRVVRISGIGSLVRGQETVPRRTDSVGAVMSNESVGRPKGLGKRAWVTTKLVRRILRALAWSRFVRVTVLGREAVPTTGPVIVASNHISMLDAVFLWGALRRRAVAIAMAELWSWPVVGWLVRLMLVAADEHEPYKPGVAKLALATGVPIIPVGTTGTDRVLPLRRARGTGPAFDRRQQVTIHFGAPIDPADFDDPDKLLDQLRQRIEDLRAVE